MNEIPKVLEPNEKIIYECKPEYAPYIASAIFGAVILGGFAGLFSGLYLKSIAIAVIVGVTLIIIGAVVGNISYSRIQYALTNKRTIIQSGIIGRDFRSIDYDMMKNVSVSVGIIGVIFKVGTVKIYTGEMETVGGKHPRMQAKYDKLDNIKFPYEVLKKLQTHLSKRKEELA